MTPEERSRHVAAEVMRKYGVKIDEQFTKHIYQVPPPLPENIDWSSPQGPYATYAAVSSVSFPKAWTIADPPIFEKGYEAHLRELMQEMEFYARYEKSGPEKFVQYEPKDREWAEYFGFIKKKRYLRQIVMNSHMLRQITDAVRASRSWAMPFSEPSPLTSLNGVPIVIDEDRTTGYLTLMYDDGSRDVLKVAAEKVAEAMRGARRGKSAWQ